MHLGLRAIVISDSNQVPFFGFKVTREPLLSSRVWVLATWKQELLRRCVVLVLPVQAGIESATSSDSAHHGCLPHHGPRALCDGLCRLDAIDSCPAKPTASPLLGVYDVLQVSSHVCRLLLRQRRRLHVEELVRKGTELASPRCRDEVVQVPLGSSPQ